MSTQSALRSRPALYQSSPAPARKRITSYNARMPAINRGSEYKDERSKSYHPEQTSAGVRSSVDRDTALGVNRSPKEAIMADIDQALVDAKIEASEARTSVKFAELKGALDLIAARIADADKHQAERSAVMQQQMTDLKNGTKEDNRSARATTRNAAFALGGLLVAIVAILVTLFSLFPSVFGAGIQLRDVVRDEVSQMKAAEPADQSSNHTPNF